jgi:hypothetical protein
MPPPPATFSEKKMTEPYSAPKLLISYSHDSPEHMARVLALSDRLRAEGVDSQLDQYETSPPEGWPRWTLNQIEWADFVLVVCTATYNRRFRGMEEKGKGRGVTWEGAVLTQDLYDAAAHNTKFIPVVLSEEDAAHIPLMLRGATFYVLNTEDGHEALYRHLTSQPRTQKPGLGKLRPLPQRTHHTPGDGRTWPAAAVAPLPEQGDEEGARASSGRSAFGGKHLLVALALVVLVAVVGLGVWRYASDASRRRSVPYRGRVVADKGGRVISGAIVSVETDGPPVSTRTDSDGVFSLRLSLSPDEAVRVRIDAAGFKVLERNERLVAGVFIDGREYRLTEAAPPGTPTPTPSPTPTRRPIIPRPSPVRVPCTVERRALGRC